MPPPLPHARRMPAGPPSRLDTDPDVVRGFLSDAAHVPGGRAAGVCVPRTLDELAATVAWAERVLPVGAQSSLTGGATPRGDVVVSTRALTGIEIGPGTVRVGAGVPLKALQQALAARRLWYPPVPTYDGAFVGGTIATNAAGAATFKYGTTRDWVLALAVVLADGSVLEIAREDARADDTGFEFLDADGAARHVPRPGYVMPDVPKLSAGYYSRRRMDLVDLFIGSEGTLGVIAGATLRVVSLPARYAVLVTCANDTQAVALTAALRRSANEGVLDVAAIELMDARSLAFVPDDAFVRAGVVRPGGDGCLLLAQCELGQTGATGAWSGATEHASLAALAALLEEVGVAGDPVIARPGDEAGASRLFELREAVPAAVNAAVAAAQAGDPEIQKTAGDFIVPFEALGASLARYRQAFESRGLAYAVWGHASDGNLHPNVVPRTRDEMARGREALIELAADVIRMGGAPLAEHGVGRSPLKQRFLRDLYGDAGITSMRAVKQALDPGWKLASGVLFPA